ncbi:response regulator transcription factor [Endozoicomonas sp. SM1973]|uniref:Response regulator transcription factor n=1 Tax=Spartinivicinus marinus TaxID=2994442 RepID=A0A853IA07_9GAMM|nr:response regulator transcription factor [Spartinivicinus marinus]NYZ67488.1 response regulator transcription factor [Spartinivicinus marinus]
MKVLLVEDDVMIADGIARGLNKAALQMEHVTCVKDAKLALVDQGVGLIVLDLGLPDGDGLALLCELRGDGMELPVLVLTARDEPRDKVLGLDSGADDYLVKPFNMDELIARIRALLRRRMGRAAAVIEYGPLTLDPGQMQVLLDRQLVTIPLRQFRLLQYLLESQGRVKTKQQIIDALYRWDQDIEENTIEVYISQLRKHLWPSLIKTMRGIGYLIPKFDQAH